MKASAIFCQHASVQIAGAAEGPLAGLTFAAKDVFAIAGVRACYGMPAWLESHEPATETAPVVRTLLAAGASLVGMVLTDELALSLTGENAHYGTPPNPSAPARVPGGSSSGSAAAVATGAADFALGTDTGGSVRVPASHTGLYGFRPTTAAISCEGVLPLAPSFDTVGWFARDLATSARVSDVLLPPSAASAPPSRLLLWRGAERFMEPGAWPLFCAAAEGLAAALSLPLTSCELIGADPETWVPSYISLQNAELVALHRAFIEHNLPRFGSLIGRRCGFALSGGPLPLTEAAQHRQRVREALATPLAGNQSAWLVLPSAPGAPPLRGQSDAAIEAYTSRALSLSALASLSGSAQLSLPLVATPEGPLGVSLLAPAGADRALFAAVRRAAFPRTTEVDHG